MMMQFLAVTRVLLLYIVVANFFWTLPSTHAARNIVDDDAQFSQVVAHDFNSDGHVDVAFTVMNERQVRVYFGDGNGKFENNQTYSTGDSKPRGISSGDINGDGVDDVVFCTKNNPGKVMVFYADPSNNGFDGPYSLRTSGEAGCHHTSVLDLNDDGLMDVIGASDTKIYALLNPGSPAVYPWPAEIEVGKGDELDIHQVASMKFNDHLDMLVCQDEAPATWLRVDLPLQAGTQPLIKRKKTFRPDQLAARAALWVDLNGDSKEEAILCYKRGPTDACDVYERTKNSKLSADPVVSLQLYNETLEKPMSIVNRTRGSLVDLIVAYGAVAEVVLWEQQHVNQIDFQPLLLSSNGDPWMTSNVVGDWIFISSQKFATTVEAVPLPPN